MPFVDSSVAELKCLELEHHEREQEANLKLWELELPEKELTLQVKMKELETATVAIPTLPPSGTAAPFDVSIHIRFVPPFLEMEVDKYFIHYEKVSTGLM